MGAVPEAARLLAISLRPAARPPQCVEMEGCQGSLFSGAGQDPDDHWEISLPACRLSGPNGRFQMVDISLDRLRGRGATMLE